MSDANEETNELKAGHPPAIKVAGGVRITQHKLPTHDKPLAKQTSKDDDDDEEQETVPDSPPKPMIATISGAPVRGNEDFPTSSVKAYHEKQNLPTKECRPMNKSGNNFIHQPKK